MIRDIARAFVNAVIIAAFGIVLAIAVVQCAATQAMEQAAGEIGQ